MSGFEAQKMLDRYIYDYLCKKNMRSTAQIFAQEAKFTPTPVALDEEDGFLTEWWSYFWEAYSNRPNMNSNEDTQAKQNFESMPGNVSPKMPVDVFNSLQNADPTMLIPRFPIMTTDVGSSSMARPDIGDFRQSHQTSLPNLPPALGPFMARPNIGDFLQSCQTSLPSPLPTVGPSFTGRPDVGNLLQWPPFPNMSTTDIENFLQNPHTSLPNLSPTIGPLPTVGPSFTGRPDVGNLLQRPPFPNLSTADIEKFLQNPHTSLPNLSPTIGPSPMARPDVVKFPQSRATATIPRLGQIPDRSGIPAIDFVIGQGLNVPTYREPRMRELDRVGLPSGELNFNSQSLGINQSASKKPSSSNPRRPKKKSGASNQLAVIQDVNSGSNTRRSFPIPAEPTVRGTRVSQITAEPAETGSSMSSNSASYHPSSEELDDTSSDTSI